jgi:hypothetical protein
MANGLLDPFFAYLTFWLLCFHTHTHTLSHDTHTNTHTLMIHTRTCTLPIHKWTILNALTLYAQNTCIGGGEHTAAAAVP